MTFIEEFYWEFDVDDDFNWEDSFSTNREREVIEAFQETVEHLKRVSEDAYHGKWAVLAYHNGFLSLMMLAIRRGDDFNILSKDTQEKYSRTKNGVRLPYFGPRRLAQFPALVTRIQQEELANLFGARQVQFSEKQLDSLQKLNKIRNDFTHFQTWASNIHKDMIPKIIHDSNRAAVEIYDSGVVRIDVTLVDFYPNVHRLINEIDQLTSKFGDAK